MMKRKKSFNWRWKRLVKRLVCELFSGSISYFQCCAFSSNVINFGKCLASNKGCFNLRFGKGEIFISFLFFNCSIILGRFLATNT
ncbi:hypothetical protein Goshw_025603 [Gossypium schwendimanii]|uniref:Uncharacterized protein n=1 Tax=Gossypium schwendimanii TaxID=34291 RepID=A0A7J9KN79_GOSSC|nr:hypothetical protein [Gossypium schwendimanii]